MRYCWYKLLRFSLQTLSGYVHFVSQFFCPAIWRSTDSIFLLFFYTHVSLLFSLSGHFTEPKLSSPKLLFEIRSSALISFYWFQCYLTSKFFGRVRSITLYVLSQRCVNYVLHTFISRFSLVQPTLIFWWAARQRSPFYKYFVMSF